MTAHDIIFYFSSNIYFANKGNNVYLIDDYHLGDSDYDYGIVSEFSVEELMAGNFDIRDIPDMYVDGYFEFLLNDDLKNTYGVSAEVIKILSQTPYSDWDIILDRNGITNIPLCLDNICRIMRCEEEVDEMTQDEIEKFCKYGDDYTHRCIAKYEKQSERDERDLL